MIKKFNLLMKSRIINYTESNKLQFKKPKLLLKLRMMST